MFTEHLLWVGLDLKEAKAVSRPGSLVESLATQNFMIEETWDIQQTFHSFLMH